MKGRCSHCDQPVDLCGRCGAVLGPKALRGRITDAFSVSIELCTQCVSDGLEWVNAGAVSGA